MSVVSPLLLQLYTFDWQNKYINDDDDDDDDENDDDDDNDDDGVSFVYWNCVTFFPVIWKSSLLKTVLIYN